MSRGSLAPTMFLLIPVYNEAGNIVRLLECLNAFAPAMSDRYCLHVIMVDDGSQDGTDQLAEGFKAQFSLQILRHDQNRGPGRAFGTAFCEVAKIFSDNDLVVTMEGDNTSRLELIRQMLHRMEEGFDVILASPYLYGGAIVHTSTLRIFLSGMANLFVKDLLGIHGILTVSSFFRMYSVPLLKELQAIYGPEILECSGFECMTEMLMKMICLGTRISEVPMVLDTKLRVGKSRMKIIRTILGYQLLLKRQGKWRRMVGDHLREARAEMVPSPASAVSVRHIHP